MVGFQATRTLLAASLASKSDWIIIGKPHPMNSLAGLTGRDLTNHSLEEIGGYFGGRDHTTVLHGLERIGTQIEADEQLRRDWLAIKQMLSEGNNVR
jgi:hypothetical protein